MQTPPPRQPSSIGLDQNIAAALGYIWIVGLIFFFMEKENKFIRFHAMQSVLYGVLWTVVMIVLVILSVIIAIIGGVAASAAGNAGGIVGLIVSLISLVIWLIVPLLYLIGLILGALKAYQGKMFKLPLIGNMAEKIASK
jgi:uncharacterized membrane protein